MAPIASRLPADVLRMAFQLLPQRDILSVAAVSQHWRATAMLDNSYYRAFPFTFDPNYDVTAQIDRLADVVVDVERCHYRVGLTVTISGPTNGFNSWVMHSNVAGAALDPTAAACVVFLEKVVPSLRRTVPFLAYLDADVADALAPAFFSALTVSAPRIRRLAIRLQSESSYIHGNSDSPALPVDLFSQTAPLLRRAQLWGTALMRTKNPCLAAVSSLDVSFAHKPGMFADIAECFPLIRHLGVHSLGDIDSDALPIDAQDFAAFDLLHSLYVSPEIKLHDILPALRASMIRISDLELCCKDVSEDFAPILGMPAPQVLELHESMVDDLYSRKVDEYHSNICLRLKSATTERCMDADILYETVFGILSRASVASTLTDISVDDRLVRSLIQTYPELPVLERLSIVLVSWYYTPPRDADKGECDDEDPATDDPDIRPPDDTFTLACPRLRTLTLHATKANTLVTEPVLLALARVLGNPHLVLANGLAAAPATNTSLEAFASVERASARFQCTAHADRAGRLLWNRARVRNSKSQGEIDLTSWWWGGYHFDSDSDSDSDSGSE